MELAPLTLLSAAVLLLALDGASVRRGALAGGLYGSVIGASFAPHAGAWWMVAGGLVCFTVACGALGIAGALADIAIIIFVIALILSLVFLVMGWKAAKSVLK